MSKKKKQAGFVRVTLSIPQSLYSDLRAKKNIYWSTLFRYAAEDWLAGNTEAVKRGMERDHEKKMECL